MREAHEMVELVQQRANKDVVAARAREEARVAQVRAEAEGRTREVERKMREEANMRQDFRGLPWFTSVFVGVM